MTDDQIQQLKKELAIATEAVVRATVNGKIDRIDSKLDAYIVTDNEWKNTVETYMEEMSPVKEGLRTVQSMNKLIKWLGFPALGALAAYWFMK